jgi:hypothetical protein
MPLRRLLQLASPGILWSTAVYREEEDYRPERPLRSLSMLLDTKKAPRGPGHVHTYADPFLFAHGEALYLFVEAQPAGCAGHIEAWVTSDLRDWTPLGAILQEPHHLSYPCVFLEAGAVYMLPESSAAGEVRLYRFERFPEGLVPFRTLLSGSYVDTSPVKLDGTWYFFTTSERGLEIHFTRSLEEGELRPHPMNPVTADPRYRRCGGAPLRFGGDLYRPAQDASERYGGDLHLMKIETLSETHYAETRVSTALVERSRSWSSLGGHHVSAASFRGRTAVAVDGQQRDAFSQKLRKFARVLMR